MQDFRNLKVWRQAHELTLRVYRLSAGFPSDERFGLTSQIRRCASSVPANIAEGCGRGTPRELLRFLRIASGSAHELEYFLILSRDLKFLSETDHEPAVDLLREVRRMLAGLMRSVQPDKRKAPGAPAHPQPPDNE